jgi:DUF4097 and DUF4098 domain-containing protein YvlB
MIALAMTTTLWAQSDRTDQGKIYREGNSWVEEISGSLPAARNVRVETDMGSVHIEGGARREVTYTIRKRAYNRSEESARRDFAAFRVSANRQGDTIVISGDGEWRHGNHGNAEFDIQVPNETELARISTRGGSVSVRNIAGRAETETSGGSIDLDGIGGSVVADTMGGSVTLGSSGGDAKLKTAGGSIHADSVNGKLLASTYGGSVEIGVMKLGGSLETAGGSIRVRQSGGDLRASTAGGSIDAGDINGSAVLKTAGGSIRLASARGPVEAETAGGGIHLSRLQQGARAETAAGGITAEFISSRLTETSLETSVGDVTVYFPSNVACVVHAAVEEATGRSQRIQTDFPELKVRSESDGEWGPKTWYADGSLNGGGATVRIRTTMGNIDIRKR